jgi:carboxymethylenebutenolidase
MNDRIDALNALFPATSTGRRGFVAGSLCGGFAASVVPTGALLAQTITTEAQGLRAEAVSIPTADGREIPGYLAAPRTFRRTPIVLVVQEIFGVHEHIRDVCRRLAHAGYCAIAPELFFRQGDPSRMASAAEIVQTLVPRVTDAQVLSDLDAALAFGRANGGDDSRLAITGFCWGGRIAWLYAAHQPEVKAAVAWYGRLTGAASPATPLHPYDVATRIHGPVLGLYGGADQGIPVDTVDEMKRRLAQGSAAARASEFVVYPDAPHAFHADYRPTYRKEAAQDAWTRALAWLRRHGVA